MECRDRRNLSPSPSGNEGQGVHVCNKCGWIYPNPHPSARHRRAHKKVCGTVEIKTNLNADDDEHLSENDSKTLNNGSEEKMEEIAVSISGFGSNRSTRSEEDVFSDAVTDFHDTSSGVSDSDDYKESVKKLDFSEDDMVVEHDEENDIADAGGSDIRDNNEMPSEYHLSSSTLDSNSNSGLGTREEESSVNESILRCSEVSVVPGKKSEDVESIPTENAGIPFEAVFMSQMVNGDFLPENAAVDVIDKQSDLFDEKRDFSPKNKQINSLVIPDPDQEVDYVAEQTEIPDKNSEGILISEDEGIKEAGKAETEVKNSLVFSDTHSISIVKHSFLNDSSNHTHSISIVKAVDDDSKLVYKDAESEDGMDNKVENNGNDYDVRSIVVAKLSESTPTVTEFEDGMNSKVEEERKYEQSAEFTNSISSVEICMDKASDSMDVNAQLEKIEASSVKEQENVGDKMSDDERFGKVDLGLISDNDEISDLTQSVANSFNAGLQEEAASGVEDRFTEERNGTGSACTDIQTDSLSQTDSLEANCGSISVLSTLSDAPAATNTESHSQPSQESHKAENAILQPKSDNGKSVEQKADKTDQSNGPRELESSGNRKNKEIIAKVTNLGAEKQHMPLKSYLGQSSPSAKDNPPKMETINTLMSTKENSDEAAKKEMGKEWNSPARYPSNIKREKGKVRRPYWASFICCTSIQTS